LSTVLLRDRQSAAKSSAEHTDAKNESQLHND